MRVPSLMVIGLAILFVAPAVAQTSGNSSAPETFSANVQIKTASGPISATIQVHIRRYTPDFDRTALESALAARRVRVVRDSVAEGTRGRIGGGR